MGQKVTRRQVLRWAVAGGATACWGCGDDDTVARRASPTPTGTATPSPTPTATPTPSPTFTSFLKADEKRVVSAAAARIIPTDDKPGAIEAGAPEYIDRLLSVLPTQDAPVGYVFAGGPFSGRNPYPDPTTGTASTNFPPNDFAQFIPLTRLQLMSWRIRLLGSATVAGANFNDAVRDPEIGWREQYRSGIAEIQSTGQDMFGAEFTVLTAKQQDEVLDAIDPDFKNLITGHVLEGTFCAPEYGGNKDRSGWTLAKYDGDSQPLGYSIFDETTMTYNERLDKPTSTANPDEEFKGFDTPLRHFLQTVVRAVSGPHFPT